MPSSNSPLETLAAFAIVFAAGALCAIGLHQYASRVKKSGPGAPRAH